MLTRQPGRSQKDWSLATATGHGMQLSTDPTVTSMDEELFAYIGPAQRSLEFYLKHMLTCCSTIFERSSGVARQFLVVPCSNRS